VYYTNEVFSLHFSLQHTLLNFLKLKILFIDYFSKQLKQFKNKKASHLREASFLLPFSTKDATIMLSLLM
jgi:hypothetical protein